MQIRVEDESTPGMDNNVKQALMLSNIPAEEAAQNIDRSRLFDMTPDSYKGLKEQLDPEAIAMERMPASITKETEDYVRQSEQHAALAKDDLGIMDKISQRFKYYKNQVLEIPSLNREINELTNKKISEGSLSKGEEEQLSLLNQQVRGLSQETQDLGIGEGEEFTVQVASATGDFIRSYTENAGILAAGVGGGAAVGAAFASFIPVPGVSTVAGATAGAIKGAVGASAVIGFWDGYQQMKGSTYNELSQAVNDQGEPLNLPHDRMAKVSQGVGVLSGIASGVAGKIISSNNPMFKRFASPKLAAKLLTGNAAMLAKMEIIGGIAESVFAEGGSEALTEFVKNVGVNFAQMDESEASMMNALEQATSAENLAQYGQAALLGGVTGGVISGGMGVVGQSGLTERFQKTQDMAKKRQEVLQTQNSILETANDIKNTKMNNIAPKEMNNFLKRLTSLSGLDENVYFDLGDLRNFADTPEKGEALRKVFGENNEMVKLAQQLDNPIEINKADLLGIVTEFPEITDSMRLTPDGENPAQARENSQRFVERLAEAEQKRNELLKDLNVDEPLSPELQQQLNELNQIVDYETEFFNEDTYLRFEDTFIDENAQPTRFDEAHFRARKEVAEVLKGEVNKDFDAIENRIFKDVDAKDIQVDLKALDTELKILDNFAMRNEQSEAAMARTSKHKQKGRSALAIDPKSMPEDLRAVYLDNETLKKRRVFADGGIDIEESAALNGVQSGAELLKILAETPSRKQIKENRVARQAELKKRIKDTVTPSRYDNIDRAFTNLTKIHLKEMDYMRTKEWTDTKRGIIKITTPTPRMETLNVQAKQTVSKMKLRDLNPTKFKVGENKMQRAAVENFVNGKFEMAFANKEKAALNNEMRKEATIAREKVSSYEAFWKKVETPKYQQMLKDAGYLDAMNDFMSVYRLDGSTRGEVEQNSFNNFVKDQVQRGEWVPTIPERLDNTQLSSKDLTFEQYEAITKTAQYMVQNARKKNKLRDLADQRAEIRTVERVAAQIDELTKKHYDFDPSKSETKDSKTFSTTQAMHEGLKTSMTALSSVKTILSQLDEHVANGFFYKTFGDNVKQARMFKRAEIGNIEGRFKSVIDQFYGITEFKKMFNQFIEIPEFKDVPTLGDGLMRKVDLLTLQAYMGDPDGKKAMENFVTRDGRKLNAVEIQAALDIHLDSKDVAFMQNFMLDNFKQFESRSLELHKRTTGDDVELVKGEPIIHRGKEYPGGYFPIKRQMLPEEVKLARALNKKDKLFKKIDGVTTILGDNGLLTAKENDFYSEMRSAEMTQQGRYKERTGSQRPLDITFENMFSFTEEIVHDLHFREVGIDNLKLLKDPEISKSIKSVVGDKKYVSLLNGMKDIVSKTTERESTLFGEEHKFVNDIVQKAHTLHAVKTLGLNLTSAAIQPASLTNLTLRLGPKTAVYLSKTSAKIMSNITHFSEMSKLAELINPDIAFEKDGIDSNMTKQSFDFIPKGRRFFKKYNESGSSGMIKFRELQSQAIQASFVAMKEADRVSKIIATLSTAEQFLNGDIEGYSLDKVQAMSESEKASTMRSVVQQAIDLTLTANAPEDKTGFEKIQISTLFSRYWVDARNGLNTMLAQTDRIRGNIKRGENMKAAGNIAMLALTTGVAQAYMNTVRNNEESVLEELKKVKDADDLIDFGAGQAFNFITAPVEQTLDSIPGINAIKYQTEIQSRGIYRNVSVPLFGVASDMSDGIVVLKDVLSMAKSRVMKGKLPTASLSEQEQKVMLTNAGYLLGGAPTNKLYSALEVLTSRPVRNKTRELIDDISDLHKEINSFVNIFKDEEDAQPFINDLKEYQKSLPQFDNDVDHLVPENTTQVLKQSLSSDNWQKVDPDTGAAGIYQFTEERWEELMALNPDMGLTENGRVSKSPEQQEKAMKWVIEDNTRGLMAYEIPVNTENLLGAHKFGFDNFAAIMDARDNESLTEVLGDEAKNPVFKNFKNVKSVKDYLKREVSRGN